MKGFKCLTAFVVVIVSTMMVMSVLADDLDPSVLVGRWEGNLWGAKSDSHRTLIIERASNGVAEGIFQVRGEQAFPVQITVTSVDNTLYLEFKTLLGSRVALRLSKDQKKLTGEIIAVGTDSKFSLKMDRR